MIAQEYKEDRSSIITKEIVFEKEDGLNRNTEQSTVSSRNSLNTLGIQDTVTPFVPTGVIMVEINDVNYLIEVQKI